MLAATILMASVMTFECPLPLATMQRASEEEGGWGMEVSPKRNSAASAARGDARPPELSQTLRSAQPPLPSPLLLLRTNIGARGEGAQKDHMDWWREAKFGMFIHWGLYAVPAGEWEGKQIPGIGEWILNSAKIKVEDYEPLQKQFNPVKFNAKDWVDIAKGAGMKYIVITSKHHDGFGLWDSAVTDWDVMNTPYGKDLLKQLADECTRQGIKLCFYHSIMDWHHPDYSVRRAWDPRPELGEPDMDRYTAYMKAQLKELLSGKYGDIGIAWFDGEWESAWTHERGVDLYNYVRSLDKDIIINNRVDKGRSGMAGMTRDDFMGDYGTPEQEIPATGLPGVDWESCMTMNNTWGFKKNDNNWKSTEQLLFNLIDVVSKGGNYLLNVGPTAEGLIPEPSVKRLKEMGGYVRVNAEAIYGAGPSPFEKLPYRVTTKRGKLYVHLFKRDLDGLPNIDGKWIHLTGLQNRIIKAFALNDRQRELSLLDHLGETFIFVSELKPNKILTTICVEIEGDPVVVTPPLRQAESGPTILSVSDAMLHGGIKVEQKGGKPNVGFWYSTEDTVEWTLQVTRLGEYYVDLEYAAPYDSEGSTFVVSFDKSTVTGTVDSTGDWSNFKTFRIGKVKLGAMGDVSIKIQAKKINGQALMNLRSIILVPLIHVT